MDVEKILENVFTATPALNKKDKVVPNYRKRCQLLSFGDVTKLSDVMETSVPVHGKGNFPTLEVTPSKLVQMVRRGLSREGIRVPSVRLNGSAATHVLSENLNLPYKDLDLIFAVDLSQYSSKCTCQPTENSNNSNNYYQQHNPKYQGGRTHYPLRRRDHLIPVKPLSRGQQPQSNTPSSRKRNPSDSQERPTVLSINADNVAMNSAVSPSRISKSPNRGELSPCTASPEDIVMKTIENEEYAVTEIEFEDPNDKDSGYSSSGSSVSSLPLSPAGFCQDPIRSRTHSLDSSSSVTSSSSYSGNKVEGSRRRGSTAAGGATFLDVQPVAHYHGDRGSFKENYHQEYCSSSKDQCWQKIKDVVMAILRELLPVGVSRTRMNDPVLTDAYVQKMVKIHNEADRWSLISLNNNNGRNLELKFVENMRRQYEFSVDSFQIILDSYQRFKVVSRSLENSGKLKLSPLFYPSVLAESVYGDFAAALRHLRHRRICTHRPEEIRGGGLLRYCYLLVRDYTPGEVPGFEEEAPNPPEQSSLPLFAGAKHNGHFYSLSVTPGDTTVTPLPRSSKFSRDVVRLEQLMCSRFFIDFSEFPRQEQKLLSYLQSHFSCEDDLKFEYLLVLRRVVDKGTICLMSDERSMIVDFITKLARETLARDVGALPPHCGTDSLPRSMDQGSLQMMENGPMVQVPYHPPPPQHSYPAPLMYPLNQNCNNNSNVPSSYYPSIPPTVTSNYAPPHLYPIPNQSTIYNQSGDSFQPQYRPFNLHCPCCHAVYSQVPGPPQLCAGGTTISPRRNVMSANSTPFYPASKCTPYTAALKGCASNVSNPIHPNPVYLHGNVKLYYTPASCQEMKINNEKLLPELAN